MCLSAWAKKWLFWLCEGSALCDGAKPNVPLAGWLKIVFKKCGWEKNKKHKVGNECRLTPCPLGIWSVCWSPVKMVYFFLVFSRLFVVVGSSFTLAANGLALGAVADFGVQNCQYTTKVDAR